MARYETDEFGVPLSTTGTSGQPFGYTGEQRDSQTGLVYLRARMYEPGVGRLLQRDPFSGVIAAPLSLNRFSYVHNNPVSAVDPSGLALNRILRGYAERFQPNCLEADSLLQCLLPRLLPGPHGTAVLGESPIKDLDRFGGDDAGRGGGGGNVTLFRAVSADELADIRNWRGFRPGGGTMEDKLFATSAEAAADWGRDLFRYDRKPFHIVEVTVPRSLAERLEWMSLDRRPAAVVHRDLLPEFNAVGTIRELPSIPTGAP